MIWHNFEEMLRDVHQHVQDTSRPVVSGDDPLRLLLGYRDPTLGVEWHIRLSDVKSWPRVSELGTPEGRLLLANEPLSNS